MGQESSTNLTQLPRPRHTSNVRLRQQVLTPKDIENVVVVLTTSWVFAAATLACFSKFNPLLFLIVVGFVTLLTVLSCGLSLLTAIVLRELRL